MVATETRGVCPRDGRPRRADGRRREEERDIKYYCGKDSWIMRNMQESVGFVVLACYNIK